MSEQLRPDGEVFVEDVVIRSPDMTGLVEVYRPRSPGMRGEELTTAAMLDALQGGDMREQLSVVISQHSELRPSSGTRASSGGDDIEIEVPAPGDGFGQVLLYAAENGSLSWHLSVDLPPEAAPTRGGERRKYRVPRAVAPVEQAPEEGHRGVLGAIGKKVLKVLVFPITDRVLGQVGDHFARRWETANRPNRLRWLGADDFNRSDARPVTDADWDQLGTGRSLLFVHGTFSSTHGGFGKLPRETMVALLDRYQGRVFGFDHHTVSVSPKENLATLTAMLPAGVRPELDLVSHSRGGLVAREIAASDRFDVRGVVMVASPNAGTVLADREHLSDLLDRITNLAQFVPDVGIVDSLEIVFSVVKQLAVGAVGGLDGLMSMNPAEGYLAELNARSALAARLRAIAADYDPPPRSRFGTVVKNGAVDLVFASADNDLVVPTAGCWDVDGADGFPIDERLVLDSSRSVDHNSFFRQREVAEQLLRWLPTP